MQKFFFLYLLIFFFLSCGNKNKHFPSRPSDDTTDLKAIQERGVLRVVTLSRSTSFFVLKNQNMGYEYELANLFAQSLHVNLEISAVADMNDLVDKLCKKEVDLIAYPLVITNDFKEKVRYTEHEYITRQMLIQQNDREVPLIKDVTELIGKEVYVIENSKYHSRLQNLNEEIGGGIIIKTVSNEEDEETLIEKVSEGEIPLTVADNNVADINKTYYDNIDSYLPLSFAQRSAWAVGLDTPELYDAVNNWFKENENNYKYKYLYHKYFKQKKKSNKPAAVYINETKISQYDILFKKYAKTLGWDWRLLASMAYQESRFNEDASGWAGAKGLMQMLPGTAKALGVGDVSDPDESIRGAVVYLKRMKKIFGYIEDKDERQKFMLAGYNAGYGHIQDAISLAKKLGKDPEKWDDNVAEAVLLKNNPEYFNDSVVKFGYLRGEDVCRYVHEVLMRYQEYKEVIKN